MGEFKIFIIAESQLGSEKISYHLGLNPDFKVTMFQSVDECLDQMAQDPHAVVLITEEDSKIIRQSFLKIKVNHPQTPVVLVSKPLDTDFKKNLTIFGEVEFLNLEDDHQKGLWDVMVKFNAEKIVGKTPQNPAPQPASSVELENTGREFGRTIIGQSAGMRELFDKMEKAAQSSITVSITGETGTGKELVARGIHEASSRAKSNFVSINVAAIPSELIESELFGHEKGAFTGAVGMKKGQFELANGGTLFLDEVAEMGQMLQVKILRVLQEREIQRVGGSTPIPIDIRLITASHKPLDIEVRAGRFREDLYYRVQGLGIHLQPLRERKEDILLLARHFINDVAVNSNRPAKALSVSAQKKLYNHGFPGNIRELRSCIELAYLMADGETISAKDISFSGSFRPLNLMEKEMTMVEYRHKIVAWYLEKYNGDVYLVAKKLDIGKSTLYRIIREMNKSKNDSESDH